VRIKGVFHLRIDTLADKERERHMGISSPDPW
jgi:hypothetical protein